MCFELLHGQPCSLGMPVSISVQTLVSMGLTDHACVKVRARQAARGTTRDDDDNDEAAPGGWAPGKRGPQEDSDAEPAAEYAAAAARQGDRKRRKQVQPCSVSEL